MKNCAAFAYLSVVVSAFFTWNGSARAQAPGESKATNVIGWSNLQWPHTIAHTLSVTNRTENIYGQVWIDGVTSQPGGTTNLIAELGFGSEGSNPASATNWVWEKARFNVDAGNNDEFMATLLPEKAGTFDYLYRYSTSGGKDWLYADLSGPLKPGQAPVKAGKLTVNATGDNTAPSVPGSLMVESVASSEVALSWRPVSADPTVYGYEVLRSGKAGGPYTMVARVTASTFKDTSVQEGGTNYYVVRAVDHAFNRSANSMEVSAVAAGRKVTVTFNVTVPKGTETTGKAVHLAGTLNLLGEELAEWDPGSGKLTRVSPTEWTISLTGKEGTEIEYKYALGSWDNVEKSEKCEEVGNRPLTLSYGADGKQVVNDTVLNWRNVAPCAD